VEEIQIGFRGILRLFCATGVILGFFISSVGIKIRFRNDLIARRKAFSLNSHKYCGLMAKYLKIHIQVKGKPIEGTNFLYVGNHMGFVDIFIISAIMPALFITSNEMRETPFLGTLCEMAGCIFVERRSRTKIVGELDNLKIALEQGFNIVLYPEATSTNGEAVLPFKKTLMMAAPKAGRPIQTGCLNYLEIDGEDFNHRTRDSVCWYGDMSFVEAMWNTATASSIKAELEFLEPIHETAEVDRTHLAQRAHAIVSAKYRPPRRITATEEAGLATAD
jgi:1-acyl-sn-glycerol-3-phosphate acyltransferase